MTREEKTRARLRIFADRIPPSLQLFTSMFTTAPGKQLARGDDLGPTFSAMDAVVLMISESADHRRRKRTPENITLQVETRLSELVLMVIDDLPLPRDGQSN